MKSSVQILSSTEWKPLLLLLPCISISMCLDMWETLFKAAGFHDGGGPKTNMAYLC